MTDTKLYRFRNRYHVDTICVRATSLLNASMKLNEMVAYPQDYDYIKPQEATVQPLTKFRFTGIRSATTIDIVAVDIREAENVLRREYGLRPDMFAWKIVPDVPDPTLTISDDGKLLTRTYADGKLEELPLNPSLWRQPVPKVPGIYLHDDKTVFVRYERPWNEKFWVLNGKRIWDQEVPAAQLTLVHTF